jgi:hypothetical protein
MLNVMIRFVKQSDRAPNDLDPKKFPQDFNDFERITKAS